MKLRLQEKTLFDLDPKVNATENIAKYSLHYLTCTLAKIKAATSNSLGGDTFTRNYIIWQLTLTFGVKFTLIVAQYPLHHITYSPAKFEVARSNGLGEDAFIRKCII